MRGFSRAASRLRTRRDACIALVHSRRHRVPIAALRACECAGLWLMPQLRDAAVGVAVGPKTEPNPTATLIAAF